MKKIIKTKVGILSILVISLISILGLSYGTFVITTNKYKASELLISNLMYGIEIISTGGKETINNKIVNTNETTTVLVKITSLNKVDSNYSLEYKITKGESKVYYASTTGWMPKGKISEYGGSIYEKIIKVVIETNSETEVEFNVSGGYKHTSDTTELLGYTKITEEYKKEINYEEGENLKDIIESETNGIYGGETKTNYLQYPTNEDKTKNIWRIIGVYEGNIKLISEITGTSTPSNIKDNLSTFYNTLEKQDEYIYKTNKFNCTTTCTESNYENIGLITTHEYNKIGGNNSYLKNQNNFFALEEETIKNITPERIEETSDTTESGLRPSIYLVGDVNVTGSGTSADPYRLVGKGDIIISEATLDGVPLENFPKETDPYIVKSVECTNGTKGYYDSERKTIRLTEINMPSSCIVDFTSGYTVSLSGTGITVSSPASKVVGRQGETTFQVTPNTGYTLASTTVTCTGNAVGTLTGNTVKVTNISENTTCTLNGVSLPKVITLKEQLLADNPTILTRTNFGSIFADSNTGTLYKANGNLTEGGKDVYYFAGNAQNNWVKFGKDQDGADLYWRIIRTNEDGGVRLLYIGPDKATTNAFIKIDGTYMSGGSKTTGMYNNTYNNTMYVGYMYGSTRSLANNRNNTTSAPIKTVTDNWYSKTINVKTDGTYTYDKYVSETAIYCNDRAGDGYSASSGMNYAAYNRLVGNKKPSYKCGNNPSGTLYGDNSSADKFTKSTSTGNGKLTYPIAQITADEISFAGGVYGTNAPAWYYYNSAGGSAVGSDYWWTMSPYHFNGSLAYVFAVRGSDYPGYLGTWYVSYPNPGVRPVLSLKSCVSYESGDGSSSNPYTVTLDSICSAAIN